MDSFLNIPQEDFTPASTSPNNQVSQLASQSSHFASSNQTFSGPSFQYDAYRQQTGLPAGGLANTFAVNQTAGLQHWDGQGSFVMPSESINLPLSKIEDFDFARMEDIDFDADSPTLFNSAQGQFVSPTTLVSSGSSSSSMQRIYPGMHSQAAQAKAQQAKQQQEMIRQQQQQQAARPLPAGQKPLPKGQPTKDPRVEESISRILNQMRQKSTDTKEEDSPSPNVSNMPRSKKDEEDMDEDERLLASEEGKKLSSKERRQLRNKVSARAFRSRRKEYIGQLEGELAAKVEEGAVLRTENQQLREENNRLTDLTRMLLSSQAFSGFLQELSQSGIPPPVQQRPTQQPTPQERPQSQAQRKDVNPHQAARQVQSQQPQIGMALMPETNIDLSLFDTPSWNSGINANDFQVFAVTELPEGPTLDLSVATEKSNSPSGGFDDTKLQPCLPELPPFAKSLPTFQQEAKVDAPTVPVCAVPAADSFATTASMTTAGCSLRKSTLGPATPSRSLEALCSDLEESCKRLASLLPRD